MAVLGRKGQMQQMIDRALKLRPADYGNVVTLACAAMLGEERNQVFSAPHLVIFPGLAIMLTVLGFNLLGDGLRDALDPRLNE